MSLINKAGKTNLLIASTLMIVWSLISLRYYGPATPLSQIEVDVHMDNVRNMFLKVGVPDANGNVELEQILAQFRHFAETDDGKPIYMVNMMKWRDQPLFRPEIQGVEGMSVIDADRAYNEGLFSELAKNASHTAYLAKAFNNAITYGFSGSGDADQWGEIGIFRYSSRRDFFNMIGSDSYLNVVYFKLASMGHIAITPTQPHGLLFNPMPNLPVLLSFIFIIAFLLKIVVCRRT
jgi:hypothetical protein